MNYALSNEEVIADLEAKLAAAKAEKATADKAKRESVKPEMRYTVKRAAKTERAFNKVYDEAVVLYRVEGHLMNEEALKAVGVEHRVGGMTYYFNTATGKLICDTGGGHVYIKKSPEMWDEVSAFIVAHRNGGDITAIVEAYAHIKAW